MKSLESTEKLKTAMCRYLNACNLAAAQETSRTPRNCVSAWKSTNKTNEPRPGFRNRKLGAVYVTTLQGKAENIFTERTCKLSNRIVIIDRQKGINAIKVHNEKIWMFLLGAAFAARLFLVVCMASRSASARIDGAFVDLAGCWKWKKQKQLQLD